MKKTIFFLMIFSLLLLSGCTSIKDIKDSPDDFLGETVTVSGTVMNTIKLGSLSGFTLEDADGNKIAVSSKTLPEEGSKATVKGVVMKELLIGVYINADKVN